MEPAPESRLAAVAVELVDAASGCNWPGIILCWLLDRRKMGLMALTSLREEDCLRSGWGRTVADGAMDSETAMFLDADELGPASLRSAGAALCPGRGWTA